MATGRVSGGPGGAGAFVPPRAGVSPPRPHYKTRETRPAPTPSNRATTSFTLVGHSADFTLLVPQGPPLVEGRSERCLRQEMEGAYDLMQLIVCMAVIYYSQLFCHFRGSLRPFRGERHVLRLASRRPPQHDPPPFFQRAQAAAQIAFICRHGLHEVFMATHDHPSGPLVICS